MRLLAFLLGLAAAPAAVHAGACHSDSFDGARFTWCTVDLAAEEMRLWLNDAEAAPYGTFARIDESLAPKGERLGVAMNAGMYHQDRAPVGLYVEDGVELSPIVTSKGPGNFGMLPNGVFCLQDDGALVVESRAFAANPPACRFATQSGPMLVIDGKLHPRFFASSNSTYVRNGVGVRPGGRELVLAISDEPVNFHLFARFFRDMAGTPNALYLDGNVSRLYAPQLDRIDGGRPMGPVLGTVVPAG
ncbi:phosphodiester glycosidase family protein [Psychromarinibacter sp. S121]|uniref:phosphodiester glycosidase family protein n=1 Tax=Psychromarinibacter sp. S121 TaxID=3415127 RepID=UPI003C7D7166